MIPSRPVAVALMSVCSVLAFPQCSPGQAQTASPASSKIWVGRYQDIEEYVRTAECVKMEFFGDDRLGRCTLQPGGPVARIAWKPLPPGTYRGFFTSYRMEIAVYALDRLLKLDMVPPAVERQIQGVNGGATVWVERVVEFKEGLVPPANAAEWEKQISRMRMFDNLTGNGERNVRSMLVDGAWNLILLDHTRAFRSGTELASPLEKIDSALWARVQALTRSELDARLGTWLDDSQIAAIVGRRDRMKTEIDKLIATRGEAAVVLR